MKSFFTLIAAILISFIPGAIGVLFTPVVGHTDAWFNTLANSSLTPAPIVFSIAWTILYTLLGIALFMIWRAKRRMRDTGVSASECVVVLCVLWITYGDIGIVRVVWFNHCVYLYGRRI